MVKKKIGFVKIIRHTLLSIYGEPFWERKKFWKKILTYMYNLLSGIFFILKRIRLL